MKWKKKKKRDEIQFNARGGSGICSCSRAACLLFCVSVLFPVLRGNEGNARDFVMVVVRNGVDEKPEWISHIAIPVSVFCRIGTAIYFVAVLPQQRNACGMMTWPQRTEPRESQVRK